MDTTITPAAYLAAQGMPAASLPAFRTYLYLHREYRPDPASAPRHTVYAPRVIERAFTAWRESAKKDTAQYIAPPSAAASPAPAKRRRGRRPHTRRALESVHAAALRALLHHAALQHEPDYPAILEQDAAAIINALDPITRKK